MFCPNCGKQISNLPCPNCGADNKVNDITISKKKSSNRKFFLLGALIIVIIIFTIFGVNYFIKSKSSSKEVFAKSISSIIKKMQNSISNTAEVISENYSFKAELDLNKNIISSEYYSFVKDLEVKGSTAVDFKNKQIVFKLSPFYKEKSLVDLSLYGLNNNIYANIGDLFSKYINIPVEEEIYNNIFKAYSSQNLEDIDILLSELEIGLNKSLKKEYFKSEKETLTIENKEINVVKHTLVLDEKTIIMIAKDLLTYLNNDKFIESADRLAKEIAITMDTEDINLLIDTRSRITEIIQELEETINEGEFNDTDKVLISIFLDATNSFTSLTVGFEDENVSEQLFVDIIKMSEDKYSFEFANEDNLKVIYGTINKSNTESNYEIYLNPNDDNVGVVKLNINTIIGTTNTTNIFISNDNIGTIKLIVSNSSSNKAQITMPDFTNSIEYTELTDEDITNIMLKLMNKESINQLITDLKPLLDILNS